MIDRLMIHQLGTRNQVEIEPQLAQVRPEAKVCGLRREDRILLWRRYFSPRAVSNDAASPTKQGGRPQSKTSEAYRSPVESPNGPDRPAQRARGRSRGRELYIPLGVYEHVRWTGEIGV